MFAGRRPHWSCCGRCGARCRATTPCSPRGGPPLPPPPPARGRRRGVGEAGRAASPVPWGGGLADAADVAARLDAGADAAVCGTRFLLSEESDAHPAYKRRLVAADETILTELFGAGWP